MKGLPMNHFNMNQDYKKASFWERLAAFTIDSAILAVPLFTLYLALKLTNSFQILSFFGLIEIVFFCLYNIFLITRTGSTIGKKILRLKVVDKNYNNIGLKQTLIRETVGKLISFLPLGIGSVWILNDKNRQALQDKLAKTYVVKLSSDGTLLGANDTPKKYEKIAFYLIFTPLTIVLIVSFTFAFIGLPLKLTDKSMEPTYKSGQYVLLKAPLSIKRSDVVLYNAVVNGKKVRLFQRAIAGPGEKIMLKNSELFINGRRVNQSRVIGKNIKTLEGDYIKEGVSYIIPYGKYFVLGDNRETSLDSRDMGFVPYVAIIGKTSDKK